MATRPSKNLVLQKATERRHIELFLELAGLPAETEFGDRPDCVLVLPGRRIGLEHRELYDQRVQAHGPFLKRFRELLQGELEARGLDVHVQVRVPALSTYFVEHPRRVAPLAREIADLAAARGVAAVGGDELSALESRFDRVFVLDARDRKLLCVAAG